MVLFCMFANISLADLKPETLSLFVTNGSPPSILPFFPPRSGTYSEDKMRSKSGRQKRDILHKSQERHLIHKNLEINSTVLCQIYPESNLAKSDNFRRKKSTICLIIKGSSSQFVSAFFFAAKRCLPVTRVPSFLELLFLLFYSFFCSLKYIAGQLQ